MPTSNKQKAHIRYKNKEGKQVPGVTTVLNVLAKPALVPWSNKLGLEGIEVGKYVDDKADIGTLAHEMIMNHFRGVKTDYPDYSPNQVSQAENSFLSFLAWAWGKDIQPLLVEQPIVSEVYQYGGTLDLLARINDVVTIVDFKTGKGIYEEHKYQVSAYDRLVIEETGYSPEKIIILNIPRSEDEKFKEEFITDQEVNIGFEIFKHCLAIYNLKKEMK